MFAFTKESLNEHNAPNEDLSQQNGYRNKKDQRFFLQRLL